MERRYAVVNLKTDQIIRRETRELAEAALRVLEETGALGFVVDGEAAEVVAASSIPFRLDVDAGMIVIAGVGLDIATLRHLDKLYAPELVHLEKGPGHRISIREADEFKGMSAGPDAVIVESVQLFRDALKRVRDAAGEPFIVRVVEGVAHFAKCEEPAITKQVAAGGIAFPEKGDPAKLRRAEAFVHAIVTGPHALISTNLALPISDIEVNVVVKAPLSDLVRVAVPGEADSSHGPLQLGDVVAEAHRASGLSVAEWNEMPQEARDAAIVAAEGVIRECAKANSEALAAERDRFRARLIAQVCHEANRAHCISIGDDSQPAWEEAPEWQRQSAMAGVQAVIENPEETPAGLHAKWMAHKLADGWKLGEVKDAEAKTHPCLVAYEELPEAQRAKDDIFLKTVRDCLAPKIIAAADTAAASEAPAQPASASGASAPVGE
jgi:hypothetical protein